jgi:hypothetical protein
LPPGYNSLASLVLKWLGIDLSKGEQTSFTGDKMTPDQLMYANTDVLYLGFLLDALMTSIKKWNLTRVFKLENKAIRPIGDLTINGIRIDKTILDENIKIYDAVVFCVFLKRNIRVAYTQFMKDGKVSSIKLYFSTDLALPAIFIAKYYIARFHQEFTFRDAKQFTGLTHAQTKSKQKLDMHFNISLTSVNIAKAEALNKYKQGDKLAPFSFSMADAKRLAYNELYTNAFISIFQIDPKLNNNKTKIVQLLQFGTDFKAAA